MQNIKIASKYAALFLVLLLITLNVIGCGGANGATRSSGGSTPGATPTPSPTPTPTPAPPGSPSLTAVPSSLAFGSRVLNTPTTLTVKITNSGSGAAKITTDTVTGSGFSVGITTPFTLNPAQSISVPVVFNPNASGTVSGSLALLSNGAALVSVPFSGTGLTPLVHSVDLSWSPSTSTSLQGYSVYRSSVSGGPYSKISAAISPTTLAFTDTTPVSGQKYFYVVTASNTTGAESAASAEVAVTIPVP